MKSKYIGLVLIVVPLAVLADRLIEHFCKCDPTDPVDVNYEIVTDVNLDTYQWKKGDTVRVSNGEEWADWEYNTIFGEFGPTGNSGTIGSDGSYEGGSLCVFTDPACSDAGPNQLLT